MPLQTAALMIHPGGEKEITPVGRLANEPLVVNTSGRRFHVEWDPSAPVTPLGQLVFFSQFLAAGGLFNDWVRTCPLKFTSGNAPKLNDLLGTILLSVLAGQNRYSHVTALRCDTVNPQGLGMTKVCSEDSVRRAFAKADSEECLRWQSDALQKTWLPGLDQPWVLDMDTTVKPVYGHQEGAEPGYNPNLKGRPCHAYHTLFVRGLRLVLDVEAHPGKQHGGNHGRKNLWRVWERLPASHRPWLVCGDAGFGNEGLIAECEQRQQKYLFRLRSTPAVKELRKALECKGGWKPALNDWEGLEGQLRLKGWTSKRRVIILRRLKKRSTRKTIDQNALPKLEAQITEDPLYEYGAMVTDLTDELLTVADLYRQRADAENIYDELKNQWGWGGFTTRDLLRCQIAARNVALIYNWWTLFVRCAEPERPREAITSRPLLLCAVGRVIESGRQITLRLTSTHAEAQRAQNLLSNLSLFLSGLINTAEQLDAIARWNRIWDRILAPFKTERPLLLAPSG